RAGEFILGIECDGATYHSAKSVRDRDRLRQEILERKGWKIHRIWSTDWFKNRDREVQRLLNSVRQAAEEQRSVITPLDNAHDEFDARLADLLLQIKEPEPAAEAAQQEIVAEKAVRSLREEL